MTPSIKTIAADIAPDSGDPELDFAEITECLGKHICDPQESRCLRCHANALLKRLATRLPESLRATENIRKTLQDRDAEHCRDCCCARAWAALGITSYTGKSIPEHIAELRAGLREALNAYILETPYQRTDHEMVERLHRIVAKAEGATAQRHGEGQS